jgi:hypothetical protein
VAGEGIGEHALKVSATRIELAKRPGPAPTVPGNGLTATRAAGSFFLRDISGGEMLKMRSGLVWIGAVSLAVLWGAPVVRAQSLGELAEREKERRARSAQEGKKAGRVVSEEDLAKQRGGPRDDGEPAGGGEQEASSSTASSESTPAAAAEEASAAAEFWRGRIEAAQKTLDEADQRARELETAARAARGAPTATRYEDGLAEAAERQRVREDAEAARSEVEVARRALNEVQDEARRAGGL